MYSMKRTEFLHRLKARGWKVGEEEEGPCRFQVPIAIAARHLNLPEDFVEFLSGLGSCVSADETTWFLCRSDYEGRSDSAFRWDEWEQMSIDAAEEDADDLAVVRGFWDEHLPFLLSVGDGYAYYAIRTASEGFGRVVEGHEPMFEEASVVAESFSEFFVQLIDGRATFGRDQP